MTRERLCDTSIQLARNVPIERVIDGRRIKLCGKIERVGPCPVCGGKDRFSINTAKQLFNCRHCGGGDVIKLVRFLDRVDFGGAIETLIGSAARNQAPRAPQQDDPDQYKLEQHRKARWLWSQRRPIAGTPADRYLREVRAYCGPIPLTLAFLPPIKAGHHPVMIAAFAMPDEPEPGVLVAPCRIRAVHLTLLLPDGSDKAKVKPNKITVGSPGAFPIVLAPVNDLGGLIVTEGIEEGLTAVQCGDGRGVWAAGSCTRMPGLAIPPHAESVLIVADSDPGGQSGAIALADGLVARGVEVLVDGLLP
jgi:hypothetical protein